MSEEQSIVERVNETVILAINWGERKEMESELLLRPREKIGFRALDLSVSSHLSLSSISL